MLKLNLHHLLALILGVTASFIAPAQKLSTRTIQTLSHNWKFKLGSAEGAQATAYDDSQWRTLSIPHDWAIEQDSEVEGDGNTGKLPWKGQGWYRTELPIATAGPNQRYLLIFDGVMAFPEVYVNGELAGRWDYGYNSFYLDVTDHIKPGGRNVLAVHADTRPHDSRWYPGAGIYRKVQLLTVNPVHAAVWGTYVTTPIIKPHYAGIRIRTEVKNTLADSVAVQVVQTILNPAGQTVAQDTAQATIKAKRSRALEVNTELSNPQLWDIDQPFLYTVRTQVYANGQLTDETQTPFGLRTIAFTPDNGFQLNGRRVQLKGVNLHHDFGPLGAAFNTRALERQLEIMKSMGVNAVRNSHNVAAPELLELCDRMGLLVFNEIFDKYDRKAGILDTTDFEAFAHRNIRNFVQRDRNHPSVFLWSVGNEIGDVQWNIDGGFHKLHTMVNYVNKYDPSRPVTLVNDSWKSAALRHFEYYDVHAWNYDRRYRLARQLEPNKSVIISESASTLSTRGFYEFPLPKEKTDFTQSLQVSSYDLNAPYWAEIADDDFMWQQDEPYIAGEFVWTGFDYLGEPTPYNNAYVKELGLTDREASRSSYFGIVDLVGLPKDRYYLYKSYWRPEETTVHILPHWNWPERVGQVTPVFVYTNGDCAELFLNGKSLGKQCKDPRSETSTERFRLMWKEVVYQPGELRAVAYRNGQKIGESTVKTTGEPYKLRLTADRSTISAGGEDLSYITVEALDREGNPHPLASQRVKITVDGSARLAGAGNGNPQSFESFQNEYVDLFYGKAVIILRSGQEAGRSTITVEADGLRKASTTINSIK